MSTIKKIVLTGGPCGGKTTALSQIRSYFTGLGWRVLIVGECATELKKSGLHPLDNFLADPLSFQKALLLLQVQRELEFRKYAEDLDLGEDKKVLIVCDRGMQDNKAYMSAEDFEECLDYVDKELGYGRGRVNLTSYDAVFHLVSTADGAEEFYTVENNESREDSLEQARELDLKTQNAWVGHPHFRIIRNDGNLKWKIRKLLQYISVALGEPEPYEIERKYLIKYPDIDKLLKMPNCQKVEITQVYLNSTSAVEIRVRRRVDSAGYGIYTRTTKRATSDPRVRIEVEECITKDAFEKAVRDEARPGYNTVVKTRFCVMDRDNGQYLEFDVYPSSTHRALLEVELSSAEDEVKFPDYVTVIREVTGDENYSNAAIADRGNRL